MNLYLSKVFGHLVILHAGMEGPLNFCVIEELNVKTLIEGIMYFVCQKWLPSEQEAHKRNSRYSEEDLALPQ